MMEDDYWSFSLSLLCFTLKWVIATAVNLKTKRFNNTEEVSEERKLPSIRATIDHLFFCALLQREIHNEVIIIPPSFGKQTSHKWWGKRGGWNNWKRLFAYVVQKLTFIKPSLLLSSIFVEWELFSKRMRWNS